MRYGIAAHKEKAPRGGAPREAVVVVLFRSAQKRIGSDDVAVREARQMGDSSHH
jgi:hypothetical protein